MIVDFHYASAFIVETDSRSEYMVFFVLHHYCIIFESERDYFVNQMSLDEGGEYEAFGKKPESIMPIPFSS